MGIVTNEDGDSQATDYDVQGVPDLDPFSSPSLRVIAAIAEAMDTDPTAMAPLYDSVDPDALNRLLDTDARLEVVFEHERRAIEVTSCGAVIVDGVEYASGGR